MDKQQLVLLDFGGLLGTDGLRLVVNSVVVEKSKAADDDHQKYYFEQHTCTENIFRATELVIQGTNTNPHGIVRYLGSASATKEELEGMTAEEIFDLFGVEDGT